MSKPVIILGNGGHAAVLTEVLLMLDRDILGFTAPEYQGNHYSIPYLGTDECIDQYSPNEVELVLGIGTVHINQIREKIYKQF